MDLYLPHNYGIELKLIAFDLKLTAIPCLAALALTNRLAAL
jgi:hypothetical protein